MIAELIMSWTCSTSPRFSKHSKKPHWDNLKNRIKKHIDCISKISKKECLNLLAKDAGIAEKRGLTYKTHKIIIITLSSRNISKDGKPSFQNNKNISDYQWPPKIS